MEVMKTLQPRFVPQVLVYIDEDYARRPMLVFRRGRVLYHAVVAMHNEIKLETFESLRGFAPLQHRGEDYPPRKAASFWLNHGQRPIAKRARAVLRGLVARRPKGNLTTAADAPTITP